MNAHARLVVDNDVVGAIPAWERPYRASIAIHYPNADELTVAIRCEIMRSRDQASAGLHRCCDEAYPTLAEAARLATLYALSGASRSTLMQMNSAIQWMIECARMIERAQPRA
jgi:hypothetical protein